MRNAILGALVILAALGAAAYIVWPRGASLEKQARAAYADAKFAEALPLLQKLAAQPDVMKDEAKLRQVLEMIRVADQRVKSKAAAQAAATTPATSRPADRIAAATQALPINSEDFQVQMKDILARPPEVDPPMGADRVPHVAAKKGEIPTWKIKELGNFNFDPDKDTTVPADVLALNGTKVRLTGFMIPLSQAEKVTDFALVPSLVACCFGQPPGVQHTITCRTPTGRAVPYAIDELVVEGTLKVEVKREDNYSYSVFELDVSSVKVLPRN